jgi:hypothetical protein
MESSTAYRPVGRGDSRPSPAYYYMMDNLLECRKESGFPSNGEFFDEDVNVYLAGLLTSHVFGNAAATTAGMIMPYDIPLFELAGEETSPRRRFNIYRANADHLLVRLGVFDNPSGRRPGSATHMALTRDAWIGRGKAYYRLAWACAAETFRRPTAIGDVMGKLSSGFERYVGVLSAMRPSCLNMIPRISNGEMFHLERNVMEEDRKKELTALYDRFLDTWTAYRGSRDPDDRKKLYMVSEELKKADPSFSFDPLAADTR